MDTVIRLQLGNGNGKKCELTTREWEGTGRKKSIPGHLYLRYLACVLFGVARLVWEGPGSNRSHDAVG